MQRVSDPKGIIEIASLHGYSLISYLPACIVCVVPINLVRWISVSIAFFLSTFFLIRNLWNDHSNKKLFPIMVVVMLINIGIAVLTKFYFFDFSE